MKIRITLFCLFLFFPLILGAQSSADISKQIWIDVNPHYYLNPNSNIYGISVYAGNLKTTAGGDWCCDPHIVPGWADASIYQPDWATFLPSTKLSITAGRSGHSRDCSSTGHSGKHRLITISVWKKGLILT
jgi:hypothetical protein